MPLAKGMKLYVVGESSGKPEDWGNYCRYIVLAYSAEEAAEMAGSPNDQVAEIDTDEPQILALEEDGGNDE